MSDQPTPQLAETATIYGGRRKQPLLDGQPFPWQIVSAKVNHGPDVYTTVTFEVLVTGLVTIDPRAGAAS